MVQERRVAALRRAALRTASTAPGALTSRSNRTEHHVLSLQSEVDGLKGKLKSWERSFESSKGRKPTRDDVQATPSMAQLYRDYARVKRSLKNAQNQLEADRIEDMLTVQEVRKVLKPAVPSTAAAPPSVFPVLPSKPVSWAPAGAELRTEQASPVTPAQQTKPTSVSVSAILRDCPFIIRRSSSSAAALPKKLEQGALTTDLRQRNVDLASLEAASAERSRTSYDARDDSTDFNADDRVSLEETPGHSAVRDFVGHRHLRRKPKRAKAIWDPYFEQLVGRSTLTADIDTEMPTTQQLHAPTQDHHAPVGHSSTKIGTPATAPKSMRQKERLESSPSHTHNQKPMPTTALSPPLYTATATERAAAAASISSPPIQRGLSLVPRRRQTRSVTAIKAAVSATTKPAEDPYDFDDDCATELPPPALPAPMSRRRSSMGSVHPTESTTPTSDTEGEPQGAKGAKGSRTGGANGGVAGKQRTAVSQNFRKMNLKRGGGGYRIGARAKYSAMYKRRNHKYRRNNSCFVCGGQGHWADDCPYADDMRMMETTGSFDEPMDLETDMAPSALENSVADFPDPIQRPVFCSASRSKATKGRNTTGKGKASTASKRVYADRTAAKMFTPVKEQVEDERATLPPDWAMYLSEEELLAPLENVWKFSSFRPGQYEAVSRILQQRSSLVIQATGSGKSLCYQLPAYLLAQHYRSFALVISPLLSLVKDQIGNLPRGLRGATLNSSQTLRETQDAKRRLFCGEVDVLYVSPEVLSAYWFVELLSDENVPKISFCCVDEAHCVSEWSHNFRPAYLRIAKTLRESLGVSTLLALTATATQATINSILKHLDIEQDGLLESFHIPDNINLSASCPEDKQQRLAHFLRNHHLYSKGPAIVYCSRQADTVALASFLRTSGVDAASYHAGMDHKQRSRVQQKFKKQSIRVLCATIAFGMGLDMPNVRVVIHYHFPKSPENFVQEVGRAGRDGQPAYCHMFVSKQDLGFLKGHAYGDTCESVSVKRLLQAVSSGFEDAQEISLLAHEAIVGTGPVGASLLSSVSQGDTSKTFVALNIAELTESLDMKETVMLTLLSQWELHDGSSIAMRPSVCATLTFNILDHEFAHRDPMLAALIAVSKPTGVRKNEYVAQASQLCGVATITATQPSHVLKGLHTMKSARKIHFEETGRAFIVAVSSEISADEFQTVWGKLVCSMKQLELSILNKLELLQTMLFTAMQCDATEDQTKSQVMNDHMREQLMKYFQQSGHVAELTSDEIRQLDAGVEVDEDKYSHLRRELRQFAATHLANRMSARAIARICYGLGSPAFPSENWCHNPLWRKYTDVSFDILRSIAQTELVSLKDV
eukprot:m.181953 g.181953  ORF g.181953 m.181953 type:complete len:1342 (+) comp14666_c0_seq5:72-4097(+)